MPPTSSHRGTVRPLRTAAVVNAEIRALWSCAAVRLRPEQRAEYARLVEEWAAAVRYEVLVQAA